MKKAAIIIISIIVLIGIAGLLWFNLPITYIFLSIIIFCAGYWLGRTGIKSKTNKK